MCLEALVCKHFQTGYCKFREQCRKQHVTELCGIDNCKSKACTKRHPKVCKFFTAHNMCRYNEKCAYLHTITKEESDTAALLIKVAHLEDTLKVMDEKLKALEEIIEKLNSESIPASSGTFKCDKCDYKASKNSILKRHKTSKHKTILPELEHERSTAHDNSLQLELDLQEREDEAYIDSSLSDKDNYIAPSLPLIRFKCELCMHESESSNALHGHISIHHNPSILHTSKWETNKCHICITMFTNTTHFKSHMLEQHGFTYDSTACLNCESSGPLGYYTPVPDQVIYMICKECELWDDSNS